MKRSRSLALVVALIVLSLSLMGCGLVGASVRMLSGPTPTRTARPQVIPLATRTPHVLAEPQQAPAAQQAPSTEQAKPTPGAIPGQGQVEAQPGQQSQAPITVPPASDSESKLFAAVYKKVSPSVVRIDNLTRIATGNNNQVDPTSDALPESQGSGWVWDANGFIVTNNHVVEGADALNVTFADGIELPAELIGTDPDSDLAVVKVDPTHVHIVPTERGKLEEVEVGEQAIAIGNPFGYDNSITTGIVSALGRSIESQSGYNIPLAIQTDAAINPGNSGGPLLNDRGQVIGVNFLIRSPVRGNSGVGFAIPINIVDRVIPALIERGEYKHAYLGVSGRTYSPAWAEALGFPPDARGAYVMTVRPQGPSGRAGLRAGSEDTNIPLAAGMGSVLYLQKGGDLIVGIDDQPVTTFDDILVYLESYKSPGDQVQLHVLRPGQDGEDTLTVTLGERPALSQ